MPQKKTISRLLYAASESSADLLYATRFFAPDAFLWLQVGGRTCGVFSPLEVDRARREARVDQVLAWADYEKALQKKGVSTPATHEVIAAVLRTHKATTVEVPCDFPLGLAEKLRALGIRIHVCEEDFFTQRQIKTSQEVLYITQAQRMAEAGMKRAVEILKASKIQRGILIWNTRKLTSEILRGEIDSAIIKLGGLPHGTIVAGGAQGCDPHEAGHGVLKPHQTIVIDIFPRDQRTGYFGDLTRTFVKGRASEAIRKLHHTVRDGQSLALKTMKAGVDGGKLHRQIVQMFEQRGYPTEQRNGRWVGFFHGTGHSLGLEIHEPPRFGRTKFKAGMAMTVEPGLYYPDIGGVRIEDLVIIRKDGIQNLTRCPHEWELR